MERDQRNALFVDLDLQQVDLGIPAHDLLEQCRISIQEAFEGVSEVDLDASRHAEDARFQDFEFLVEAPFHHPNRPVR
jgi:hypothetical protein